MKKRIRKLLYFSFVVFVSISFNFDIEARLPKYMAKRAAELLIEKSGLVLKEETDENKVQKRQDFAKNLVDFLYSTEKRQHLANWMKNAYKIAPKNRSKIISGKTLNFDEEYTEEVCTKLFNELQLDKVANINWITTCKNSDFINFVNQCFPCWTGTLTCFMLTSGKASVALYDGKIVEECQDSLNMELAAYKVVGILFTLELVDNWDDIKNICKKKEEPIPELSMQYDPYGCVPVPNTAYVRNHEGRPRYQGSCMISTIRNLVYILCRSAPNSIEISKDRMYKDIKSAFSDSIYAVSGTTSKDVLGKFAQAILPEVTTQYQPTLELFVCTLNSLLREDLRESIPIPTPQQYLSKRLLKTPTAAATAVENILQKITGHGGLNVTLNNAPTKLSSDWPELCLIINDPTVCKKITVAFGCRGAGHHVEIIDITSTDPLI